MTIHDDEVDLPAEQRRRIETAFARLTTWTHYELLGVDPSADRRALSRAYLERTLEFQSSRYFARRLGHYRAMMDRVFERVTVAHDTLITPAKRAAYDAELRRARLASVEAMLALEEAEMQGAHASSRREEIVRPTSGVRIGDGPPRTQSGTRVAVRVDGTTVPNAKTGTTK